MKLNTETIKQHKTFEQRYAFDVRKVKGMVSGKNGLDYISWANAEKVANIMDENATWQVLNIDKELGFVKVEMTINGKTRTIHNPILDGNHNPIFRTDDETVIKAFTTRNGKVQFSNRHITPWDINNAIMRGFAKLFSMITGYGLSLYTGEDLRIYDTKPQTTQAVDKELMDLIGIKGLTEAQVVAKVGKPLTQLNATELKTIKEVIRNA